MEKNNFLINPQLEFTLLYFDKILLLGIDKCLRLNKKFRVHVESDFGQLIDTRDKNMESCLDKIFALHRVFDDEYTKLNNF